MKRRDLFMPGDLSLNRFKIIKKLAKGGYAVAYLAQDQQQNNNMRVLKVSEIEPNNIKKIEGQYELICSLDHPNIIKAYGFYRQQIQQIQYLFIIMEYAQGGDLKVFLGKLTEEDIFKIYNQVKEVIQYIHARGVIHRDLTLANILLDKMKNIKVIDFGISTQLEQQQTHINSKFLRGNRLYQPRQFVQSGLVSKQNDFWQFGITLLQLVSGKEISQLTNDKMPYSIKKFPEQVFTKHNVNKKFIQMISPLLISEQYKERRFCQGIIITELTETISKIQVGSNKKGIKIKSRQPIQPIQSVVYETVLKLIRITDIQLQISIKQYHYQHLLQLNCSDCLLTDQSGTKIRQLKKLQKLQMSGNNLTDKFTYNIQSVLPSLITLKLAFTDIRDESMSLITKKSLILEQLDISYTLITSAGIIILTKLTQLSSLAIWSGQYWYPQRYEDIIDNGNNQGKYKNNKMAISQQCIKQLCKLNLTEICINANETDIDELILRIRKQSKCVQVRGRMSSEVVEYICEMEKLQKVYLYEVKEFEIKEFRSNELRSCGLINCKINENKLIKTLANCNKMTSLELSLNKIGNQGAIEIAKNMKSLTSLDLRGNDIGNQGAIQIAKNMKSLTSLNLNYNKIGKQGAIEIAKNMKSLTSLNLNRNDIGKQGAIQIAKNMKSLTSLNLNGNNIGKQGAIQIAKNMKSLTSLNLRGNDIGKQGAIQIAKNMKSLTSLNLNGNNIGNQGAIEIAKNMKSLTSLNLNENNIGKQGAIEIAKNMKSLTSLDLYENNIGNQGAIEIAKNMKSLTSLNLSSNKIVKQGAIEIAKNMKSLTSLNLNNNNIGKQGAIEIAKNMKSLTSLNLRNNNIGNQGAIEIAKNMKSLTSLDLWNNNIGKQGAIEIAKNMKSLTSLNLCLNKIGKQGAIEIAKNMKTLTSLNLWLNNIDNDTYQLIKKMLPTTSTSI